MSDSLELNALIAIHKKIKKIDKPILKPIEKKKRGRKKKPVIEMTVEKGEFNIAFD
jgi:hypothetical protein